MSLTLLFLILIVHGCLGGSGNNLHLGIQLLDESEKNIAPFRQVLHFIYKMNAIREVTKDVLFSR